MRRPMRIFPYLWTLPNTLAGLAFLPVALLTGGKAQVVSGVLEIHGPGIARLLRCWIPVSGGAAALTLGHVVLGTGLRVLEQSRSHERIHVRQYERWGIFFIPAYLLSSLWAFLEGRHPYYDNRFERDAYKND